MLCPDPTLTSLSRSAGFTNASRLDTTLALASRHMGGMYQAKIRMQARNKAARTSGIRPRTVVTPIATQAAMQPPARSNRTTDLAADLATTRSWAERWEP